MTVAGGFAAPAAANHDTSTGGQFPEECEGPGFNDTPQLPDSPWQVHDPCRPQPPAVDPGEPTIPDPPEDATVLIGDGENGSISLDDWNNASSWTVEDGYVTVGDEFITSKQSFGDGHYHVEWRVPTSVTGSSQTPGNSGFFLASRYEIQVLNNYENPTYADGYAGSVYGQHPPLVNASRPKGEWQTYDVIWRAPRFADDGSLESPGVVTVFWNDVLVQAQTVLNGPTVYQDVAEYSQHPVEAPIQIQDHGQPVQFRNVWYAPEPSPASVLEFGGDQLTVENGATSTIQASAVNEYSSEMTAGDVTLTPQSGSEVTVTPKQGTSFDSLAPGASQSMSWEVTRPSADSGPHLLNAAASFTVGGEQKTVDFQVPVYPQPTYDPPLEDVPLDQTQVASMSNGMKIDVAPDGRVFFTTRGKGFSTRYPEEPTGTARIGVYHPDTGETTTALEKEVHAGIEDGGQGIVFDPNFEENGWVYFFYSPSNHVIADNDEELQSLDTYQQSPSEAEQGPQPYNLVSRFTVEGDTIDPESETEIIRIPSQRERCCHVGGALSFDLDGNLLITTGDDTDPFESSGYAPIDERDGRKYFDAQRTSANTNDLRGSLLRITPKDDGGYTVPDGNLFTGEEYAQAREDGLVKTEIYAMGFRNPFTMTVDEETGIPYIGDYGPDAGEWNPDRGPLGITEIARVDEPGFYGWPYFTGMNIPYKDYNFATGESGDPFNPDSPTNDSPNNDGLTELPPAQPAAITTPYNWDELLDAPDYADEYVPDEIPYTLNNTDAPETGAPMAGEIYRYEDSYDPEVALPQSYDGVQIFMDYNSGWLKTAQYGPNGEVESIGSFGETLSVSSPMNLHTAPDGSLYLLDYPNALYHLTRGEPQSEVEPISAPFGYDAGGGLLNGTVTIDGLEYVADSPAVRVSNQGGNSPAQFPDLEIEGTDHDDLYRTEQWGENLSYEVAIENGTYDVTLYFAEGAFENEGARVFNVSVEGQQVISELDLVAEVGYATAYTKTVEGVGVTDGSLSITMSDPVENSKISGFAIRPTEVEVPTEGLVGQWKFNEENIDGDTVMDASGNEHAGTIVGGVTTGIDAPSIPGDAAEFNGEDGTVLVSDDGDALDPTGYTVSTWIKSDDVGQYGAPLGKSGSMWAGFDGDGATPRFDPDDNFDTGAFLADTGVADGEWHHLVYRHDAEAGTASIYIDGRLAGSSDSAGASAASDAPLGIGSKSNEADWISGLLADVRLYDRPLSGSEVLGLYQYEGDTGGGPGENTFELGGRTSGWVGQAPSSIEGTTNPTLEMTAGEEYTVTWENLDGVPHDFKILDSQGNEIVGTETITEQGATASVTFTATENMAEYYCSIHPTRMRGDVSVDGGGGGGLSPVVGDAPPTDPNGDGLYEDVNGDGEVTYADVVDLFENFDSAAVQNNPEAFDFNGNGRLDFDDVITLFRSL